MLRGPGPILRDRFFVPLGVSPADLARGTGLHRSTVRRLLNGTQPITLDVAVRLGAFLGVPARWFIQLQADHDVAAVEAQGVSGSGRVGLVIDPDFMITPGGVISLTPPVGPVKEAGGGPRTVRYANGSVALLGSGS